MHLSASMKRLLLDRYPHCAELLQAFAPLFEFQCATADALPLPTLPPLRQNSFLQGKAYLQPDKDTLGVYLDAALLAATPGAARAVADAMPGLKAACTDLEKFLQKNLKDGRDLIAHALLGKRHRIAYWAKKRGMHKHAAALVSTQLAQAAARRTAKAAAPALLSWDKGYCPVCASMPHAGCVRGTEGRRFLQCSLCGHEWRFSRTVCPFCEEARPEQLNIFFLEGDAQQARAEGCESCKRYLVTPDLRASLDAIPLEMLVLCLMPLDMLMREKGYLPLAQA